MHTADLLFVPDLGLVSFHGRTAVDVKAAVGPVRDLLGQLGAEAALGDLSEVRLKYLSGDLGVEAYVDTSESSS